MSRISTTHPDTPDTDCRMLKKAGEGVQELARFRLVGGLAATAQHYGRGKAILVGLRMGREQWRRGHSPGLEDMLGALTLAQHEPLARTDQRDVEIGVWDGGAAKYLVAVRHVPPPPPTSATDRELIALDGFGPLETEVRLQGAWDVYQLIGSEQTGLLHRVLAARVANGETLFSTTVPLRDFNVYAIFPDGRGPRQLQVKAASPEIKAGSTTPIHIELDVAGYTPVELEVSFQGQRLYGDQLLLHDGKLTYSLATAPNDPPGEWRIRVRDLIAGLEASVPLVVNRGTPASQVARE